MSYARFGWDGSDVYVIPSDRGLECCGCHLQRGGYATDSIEEFASHLDEHQAAGHVVPDDVMPDIRADLEWLVAKGIVR